MKTNIPMALRDGIAAAKAGNKLMARLSLETFLASNPDHAMGWLWLAWVSDSPSSMILSLERARDHAPEEELIEQGLRWARSMEAFDADRLPPIGTTAEFPEEAAASERPGHPPCADGADDLTGECGCSCVAAATQHHDPHPPFEPLEEIPPFPDDGIPDADFPFAERLDEETLWDPAAETLFGDDEHPLDVGGLLDEQAPECFEEEPAGSACESAALAAIEESREAGDGAEIEEEPAGSACESAALGAIEESREAGDGTEIEEETGASPPSSVILAVDDSPTIRKLVSMSLTACGYNVVTATDGVDALQQLSSLKPALLLVDINMPRLDGYRLCKLIKNHDRTRLVPVIMLSGKDGVFDKLRGRMVGCDDYMTKPFDSAELVRKVSSYVPVPAFSA